MYCSASMYRLPTVVPLEPAAPPAAATCLLLPAAAADVVVENVLGGAHSALRDEIREEI